MKDIRASLVLIGFTLLLCCGAYPFGLWVFGRVVFPDQSGGSLLTARWADGRERVVGSARIAQPFTGDEYFWPRPSAAGYNAAAAGGSNWGANNPKLRDRVAQQLGPMIRYRVGSPSAGTGPEPRTPQQDIETWFAAKPDRAADWAGECAVAANNWARTDLAKDKYGLQGAFILAWAKNHPEVTHELKPEDLIGPFFAGFAKANPGKWPGVVEVERPDKTKVKEVRPVSSDSAVAANTPTIAANFVDMWLQDPANRSKVADLEPVPADMVTASGAGLDPHITLRNALSVYQLGRVVARRTPPGGDGRKVREEITALVRRLSSAPLGGLAGEPLVNVLELNLALDASFPVPPAASR